MNYALYLQKQRCLLSGTYYFWIRGRGREGCFRAFNHNNWVGGAIFAGIALDYYVKRMA